MIISVLFVNQISRNKYCLPQKMIVIVKELIDSANNYNMHLRVTREKDT
jgi:hypothetical protein